MTNFAAETHQNVFLPLVGREMHAVVTVAHLDGARDDDQPPHVSCDVTLRLWTPEATSVLHFWEEAPIRRDLAPEGKPVNDREVDYRIGPWPGGSRDFSVELDVPAQQAGDRWSVGRIQVIVDGEEAARTRIFAEWTGDDRWASADPWVARYGLHPAEEEDRDESVQTDLTRTSGSHEDEVHSTQTDRTRR
jgi:hypothetical protein